jgi:hypothetical protein
MPHFAPDETDELVDYISHKFSFAGGVQDYEEQDDGTVLVAVTDTDFDPENAGSEEDDIKAARQYAEDGDVFGIIHFDRDGEQIDSIWGMVGYGGAKKAIKAYKDDYYTPQNIVKPQGDVVSIYSFDIEGPNGKHIRAGTKIRVRAHQAQPGKGMSYPAFDAVLLEDASIGGWDVVDVQELAPSQAAAPAQGNLTSEEERWLEYMVQELNWPRDAAVKRILQNRRSALSGLPGGSLFDLPSWARKAGRGA